MDNADDFTIYSEGGWECDHCIITDNDDQVNVNEVEVQV